MKQNYFDDKLIDVHINNLNNIQKIISRLSNIGYTLLSLSLTIMSIILPLVYTLNIALKIRIILIVTLLVISVLFFVSHLINLRNEKRWRLVYDEKCNLDLNNLESQNKIKQILSNDFEKTKSDKCVPIITCLKSWLSIVWAMIFLLQIITLVVLFFIY